MLRAQRYFLSMLFFILSCLCSGCGGGSEGTGTLTGSGRTLVGTVRTTTNEPVAGATVTLIDNGDSTTTDAAGSFALALDEKTDQVTLEIQSNEITGQVEVGALDTNATKVSVDLTINTARGIITAKNIQVWAKIVGLCDPYFENLPIIRQSNTIPGTVECTTKFFASGDGARLSNIPAAVQVRPCGSRKWTTIAEGETGTGINAGVGQMRFVFADDLNHCEYRVVAPYNVTGVEELSILIQTLTLQSR